MYNKKTRQQTVCIHAENKNGIIVICVAMAPSSGDEIVRSKRLSWKELTTWSCCLSASGTFPSEMFCLRRSNSWTANCHNSTACSLSWQQKNVHMERQLPTTMKLKMLLNLLNMRLSWIFLIKYDNCLEPRFLFGQQIWWTVYRKNCDEPLCCSIKVAKVEHRRVTVGQGFSSFHPFY